MNPILLNSEKTALVLIDLQQGIVGLDVVPRSGKDVLANAIMLAEAFRAKGSLVVLVRVSSIGDGKDMLHPLLDKPPMQFPRKEGFDVLVPELGPKEGDIVITKHQWGAFYGTELDLQLRRRQIDTIVLGGISTNIGVESTARDAFERGYNQIFVEDIMATNSGIEAHSFAVQTIFTRMGRVRSTQEVLKALSL